MARRHKIRIATIQIEARTRRSHLTSPFSPSTMIMPRVSILILLLTLSSLAIADAGLRNLKKKDHVFVVQECPADEAWGPCSVEGQFCPYEYRKIPSIKKGRCSAPYECRALKMCQCGAGEWRCFSPGMNLSCDNLDDLPKQALVECKP